MTAQAGAAGGQIGDIGVREEGGLDPPRDAAFGQQPKERAGRAPRGRAWTSGPGGCQDGAGARARKGAAGGVT